VIFDGGCRADSYQTLQLTRQMLDQSNYSQIPQLSSGLDIDLDNMSLVL
jgi:predicted nucleotide-binding protein (sugar kinase/HSP70/actin superfamily)